MMFIVEKWWWGTVTHSSCMCACVVRAEVLDDPSINTVVEVMGGVTEAKEVVSE
jgi:hypothetical protein